MTDEDDIKKQANVLDRVKELRMGLYTVENQLKELMGRRDAIKRDLWRELNSVRNNLDAEIASVAPVEDIPDLNPPGTLRGSKRSVYGDKALTKSGKMGSTPVLKEVLEEIVKCFQKQPVELGVTKQQVYEHVMGVFKLPMSDSLETSLTAHLRYMIEKKVIERVGKGHYKWIGRQLPDDVKAYQPPVEDEMKLRQDI